MRQARVLTEPEFKRLLAVVAQTKHAERNRLAIMLSHLAGLRVGEIAGLLKGDVLEEDGTIRERLVIRSDIAKGGHERVVFIGDRLRHEIERFRRSYSAYDKRLNSTDPLLTTQKRAAFSPNTLCQLMNRLYGAAGLDGATSHSGRRWFITKLANAGVGTKVIMTLAGHKHMTTTQRYIDVREDMLRAAVEFL